MPEIPLRLTPVFLPSLHQRAHSNPNTAASAGSIRRPLCLSVGIEGEPSKRGCILRPVCLSFISPTKPQSPVRANINSSLLTYLPVQRNIWPGSAHSRTTSGQAQISWDCVSVCVWMIQTGGQSEFSSAAVYHYKAITLRENLINRTCNAVTPSRQRG